MGDERSLDPADDGADQASIRLETESKRMGSLGTALFVVPFCLLIALSLYAYFRQ